MKLLTIAKLKQIIQNLPEDMPVLTQSSDDACIECYYTKAILKVTTALYNKKYDTWAEDFHDEEIGELERKGDKRVMALTIT